jgi:hypothetical protein
MTRTELLEHYLKPTDLTVKELIDRNAFSQIMQFVEAYHLEQLRIGGVSQQRELLLAFFDGLDELPMGLTNYDREKVVEDFIANNCG